MKKWIIISVITLIVLYLIYYYLTNKPDTETDNSQLGTVSSGNQNGQGGWFNTGNPGPTSNTTSGTSQSSGWGNIYTQAKIDEFRSDANKYRAYNNCANGKVLSSSAKQQCNEASPSAYLPTMTGDVVTDTMLRAYAQQKATYMCFKSKLNNAQDRSCKQQGGL